MKFSSARPRVRFIAGLTIGLALPFSLALGFVSAGSATQPSVRASATDDPDGDKVYIEEGPLGLVDGDGPCHNAQRIPDARLSSRAAPVEQLRPRTSLANGSTLSEAWLCGSTSTLLRYDSGVDVFSENNWAGIPDVAAKWQAMIDQANEVIPGSGGYLEPLRGTTALVLPPERPGAVDDRPGVVRFVEGATLITVSGAPDVSVADLLNVARSLR